MLNGLALFAGYGGLEIGLSEYVRTVCYVERELYPVAVIRSRIKEGKLDDAPIWDDVTTFDGTKWRGKVDIISGGFPCQDISVAGKGRGIKEGTRSGLWFEFLRIINEVRPAFVFVENVSALTHRGLDIVLGQLSEAGYDARWTDLRASDVGAPHRRERMFILAYNNKHPDCNNGREVEEGKKQQQNSESCGNSLWDGTEEDVADTISARQFTTESTTRNNICERRKTITENIRWKKECEDMADTSEQRPQNKTDKQKLEGEGRSELQSWESRSIGEDVSNSDIIRTKIPSSGRFTAKQLSRSEGKKRRIGWEHDPADLDPSSESFVGRVVDGGANRVDRIKCLGNGVVPQQAERVWEILTGVQE